jgi:hypothetical protein
MPQSVLIGIELIAILSWCKIKLLLFLSFICIFSSFDQLHLPLLFLNFLLFILRNSILWIHFLDLLFPDLIESFLDDLVALVKFKRLLDDSRTLQGIISLILLREQWFGRIQIEVIFFYGLLLRALLGRNQLIMDVPEEVSEVASQGMQLFLLLLSGQLQSLFNDRLLDGLLLCSLLYLV